MSKKKLLFLFLILLVIGIIIFLQQTTPLGDYFSLSYIKSQQAALSDICENYPYQAIAIYFISYILITALSIPGAAIITLVGGAMFGVVLGTVIVSFASSIGATLAFLISRWLLHDFIQESFNSRLKKINEGIKKEGPFYLFALRLVPLFPFFLINILMGLTPIKTWHFYIVSQAGMFLGTVAYVNAGKELGKIESLGSIISPTLLISFAILGIVPLVGKGIVGFVRKCNKMRDPNACLKYDYNIVAIGAGAGGLVTSLIGTTLNAKVALIEKDAMGGDCLNTGCVPSKALIRVAKVLYDNNRAKEFGLTKADVKFEFKNIMKHVHETIAKVAPNDSVERFTDLGVDCFKGTAKVLSPHKVSVGDKVLTTKSIIIATGGTPGLPPVPGLKDISPLTSFNLWDLKELPKRLLVLGGGPIGCEMSQTFRRFGSDVTVVEMMPTILIREDEDVSSALTKQFLKEGINLLTNCKTKKFYLKDGKKFLDYELDGKDKTIEFDQVIVGAGRIPNVKGFGLEDIGIKYDDRGLISPNEFLQTNIPNIYIIGDAAGSYQFTHFAAHQAYFATVNALFRPFYKTKADYSIIPWCTFTNPEVAHAGLSEKDAKSKGIDYEVTKYNISELDRAIADVEDYGFVKVLTPPGKDKILGVTIVGTHASDLIAEFILAMRYGLGLTKIMNTIHIYPTHSEANRFVAANWKKNHVPKFALKMLKLFFKCRRS